MSSRKFLLGAVLVSLLATPAFSADVPTSGKPSVATLQSWGQYIGAPWRFGNSKWCGLYACLWLKSKGYSCPGYHTSAFFAKFRPTSIRPGVIAVNSRHVGIVTAVNGNSFTMLSGNTTGRAIAYNERSIRGWSFREPR